MLKNLISLYENKTIYGSWIFSGKMGTGKFETAFALASHIIEKEYGNSGIKSLEMHPALKIIKKDITNEEKKSLDKEYDKGVSFSKDFTKDLKHNKSINMEQIQELITDFTLSNGDMSKSRIVIIDSINDLNKNSANCLLKFLEEPPKQTIIILICHNLGSVLPTIKSRCRKILFKPLNAEKMTEIILKKYPYTNTDDLNTILFYANGSSGSAIDFVESNGLDIYASFRHTLENFPNISYDVAAKTVQSVISDSKKVEIFKNFILLTLSNRALNSKKPEDCEKYTRTLNMMRDTDMPFNLDTRQVLIAILMGNI